MRNELLPRSLSLHSKDIIMYVNTVFTSSDARPLHAHKAPTPEPVEEPLPGEHPVPQEDPVPSPNPEMTNLPKLQ
jgi:hypothetical protein